MWKIVPFLQNFLHCPVQVSSYFVLFFVPYICISMWSLQPNRDECWYDGTIRHWKVANGRDGEYSLLNIFQVVQVDLLRDSGHFKMCQILIATSRKKCFGISEINNEMHILRIQRLLIPTNLAVFQPISVASDQILRYCGLCNYSCHQYLVCRSPKNEVPWCILVETASWIRGS